MLGSNTFARRVRAGAGALAVAVVATVLVGCAPDECGSGDSCAVSFPADAKSKIDETVRKNMDAGLIPGALVTVHAPGRGTYTQAYGVADLATGRPMTVDDHVRIGSITKTFTATAILRAADEGKLALDDVLSKYVPGVPNGDTITLRDLLGMRGGVWDLVGDSDFAAQLVTKTPGEWRDGDRLRAITAHPEHAKPPRTNTEYSNSEFVLLGLVLEKVIGKPVHEVLDELARAHGLQETSYPVDATIPSPASQGYTYFDDAATNVTSRNSPAIFGAAGTMVSTISDLATYAPLLAKGDLLKPETSQARQQFTSGTAGGAPFDYGLGLQRFGPWLGHAGGVLGYTTHVGYLPDTGAAVAVAVNQYTVPPTLLRITASDIWGSIVEQLYPESLPGDRPTPTIPSPQLPAPADLSTHLQQAFDTTLAPTQKTLRVAADDKDPELITKLAKVYAGYSMTFRVDKLTDFDGTTLLATTTVSSPDSKRPMVIPFTAHDNTWRLDTNWVCESLLLGGESSPACT
ncbi:serine hydrolase domain-containing protein [Nocardia iowensis]|uniref:Beta-lactamase family protein n=1 Tax=Nocardia iowensis TaxID=204891 RepID=A0ABX8RVM0_NOCIO|nr:serine hydrolase domain-containing protein [Nocardia iowensis]QXN93598.1 beta-lactamase family protein [Nocardia iowensis]